MELNLKFSEIEFRATLPKHHEGIGSVEQVIGVIKNTVSKSITGPNLVKMDDEELLTWLNLVIQRINARPLILGAPMGITLIPNHVLQGFRNTHGEEINPENPVQRQLNRWNVALLLFGSLWTQEFSRRNFLVVWKQQKLVPSIGDIVLFRNEPCYKHQLSAARITNLLKRKNGDIFAATIEYRREVGGRIISVDRSLRHLYPFMNVETAEPQERIPGLEKDGAAGTTAPGAGAAEQIQDEISQTKR